MSLMVPLFMEMGPSITTTSLQRKESGRASDGSETCLELLETWMEQDL